MFYMCPLAGLDFHVITKQPETARLKTERCKGQTTTAASHITCGSPWRESYRAVAVVGSAIRVLRAYVHTLTHTHRQIDDECVTHVSCYRQCPD